MIANTLIAPTTPKAEPEPSNSAMLLGSGPTVIVPLRVAADVYLAIKDDNENCPAAPAAEPLLPMSSPKASSLAGVNSPESDLFDLMIRNAEDGVKRANEARRDRRLRVVKNLLILLLSYALGGGGFFLISYCSRVSPEVSNGIQTFLGLAIGRSLAMVIIIKSSSFNVIDILRDHPTDWKSPILIFAELSPFFVSLGYVFYDLLVRQNIDISILSAVSSVHIILPIFYGLIFLREKATWKKLSGIMMSLAAVVLFSIKAPGDYTGPGFGWDTVLFFIGVILSWGSYLIMSTLSGKKYGWKRCLGILLSGNLLLLVVFLVVCSITGHIKILLHPVFWAYVAGHLIASGGYGCYVKLTSENEQSTYTALTSLWIVVPIILGIVVLGEVPTSYAIAGFIMTVLSVVTLMEI